MGRRRCRPATMRDGIFEQIVMHARSPQGSRHPSLSPLGLGSAARRHRERGISSGSIAPIGQWTSNRIIAIGIGCRDMPSGHGAGLHSCDRGRPRIETGIERIDRDERGHRPISGLAALDDDGLASFRMRTGAHIWKLLQIGETPRRVVEAEPGQVREPGWPELVADHAKRCAVWLSLIIAVHPFKSERVLPAPAMTRSEIEQRAPHAIVRFLHDDVLDRDRPLRRMMRRSGWLWPT